ncbi:MAG: 3'-5' exonuclease [Longimicrobiales bacterium]
MSDPAQRSFFDGADGRPADPARAPLDALSYVVVDVETTGGALRDGHRITEVCAVRCTAAGEAIDEYHTLVNPLRPIPPYVTRLTNITSPMVAGAPTFREIAAEFAAFLGSDVFVAHNARFDRAFIDMELGRALGRAPLRERVLCTVRLARKVLPEVRRRSLDSLTYHFGVENVARHRAYGDARATVQVLARLLRRVEDREIYHWDALRALLNRRAQRKKRTALPTWCETDEAC